MFSFFYAAGEVNVEDITYSDIKIFYKKSHQQQPLRQNRGNVLIHVFVLFVQREMGPFSRLRLLLYLQTLTKEAAVFLLSY